MLGETAVLTVPPPATGSFGGWANGPCGGRTPCSITPTSTLPITVGAVANPGAVPAGATTFGASGGRTQIIALASDGDGNLYVTGTFEGTLPLGPSVLLSAGKRDIFVAKLAPDRGSVLWASAFGSVEDDDPTALTLDPADGSGAIWVVGTFRGNLAVMLAGRRPRSPTAGARATGSSRVRSIERRDGAPVAARRHRGGQAAGRDRRDRARRRARRRGGRRAIGSIALERDRRRDGRTDRDRAHRHQRVPLAGPARRTLASSLFRGAAADDSATALDANGIASMSAATTRPRSTGSRRPTCATRSSSATTQRRAPW